MDDLPGQVLASTAKHICVSAAPGAGKTSEILLPKIRELLGRDDVAADDVLLLTFSRMSAADLRKKVGSLAKVPRVTTVHSYALSFLLSENSHGIRQRISSIVLDFEQEALLCDLKLVFPATGKKKLRKNLALFSAAWAQSQAAVVFEENDEHRAFKNAVVNWLTDHSAAMMEEVMYNAVDLGLKLTGETSLTRPRFVLVDEYQDLNKLEQEFVSLLARKANLLMVAGDPDQSIYSFKYAHPDGIKSFSSGQGVASYQWSVSKRCPLAVIDVANQLLQQVDPTRSSLLTPLPTAIPGEVHLVQKEYQPDEFRVVLSRIAECLRIGTPANSILVLMPRRKLSAEFADYANANKSAYRIPDAIHFDVSARRELSNEEQFAVLLLGLVVDPKSALRLRSLLGLGDQTQFASEVAELRQQSGDLLALLHQDNLDRLTASRPRVKRVIDKLRDVRDRLAMLRDSTVENALELLLPPDDQALSRIRDLVGHLRDPDDDLASLYGKLLDELRSVPIQPNTVPVMTIMASKGLDADHVFILGCNAGNLPGERRAEHLTQLEHQHEQLRLLFVGVTRAKKSLHMSWSRFLPFNQTMSHNTPALSTIRRNGETYQRVGMSPFLQALKGLGWEA